MLYIPNRLSDLVADGEVVAFIGSGFSLPSGLPTWSNLVEGLIRNCVSDDHQSLLNSLRLGGADLTDILDALSTTEFAAKEYLIEHINSPRYEPADYHKLLLELNCTTIITTNWDTLLEQAFSTSHVAYRVIYRDIDVAQFNPDRAIQVIKLHGTILDPDSLIYKRSQYRRFWDERQLLLNLVSTLMATKSFLFMGYGFGDPNVLSLINVLRERLGPLRREHYALVFGQNVVSSAFLSQGIHLIDGADVGDSETDYENQTKQFISKLAGGSRLSSLNNLERSRLINSELSRVIARMPPKAVLRMRGSLGWLSNPIPIEDDPVYGTFRQDQEERRMTELICQYLESNRAAIVRCILHLEIEPLLRAGYQPRHLVRRFSTIKDLLLRYGPQIEVVNDATPSYLNQMFFDERAYLFGFKHSQRLGIQRAIIRRTRSVVRAEVSQFDEEYTEIRANNLTMASGLGIDVTSDNWTRTYILQVIEQQIEDLESTLGLRADVNTQFDLITDVIRYTHAVEFALGKHREYGQTREDGVTPYGIHILRTVERLRQLG